MALLKFELFKKYPELYNFIMVAYFTDSDEVRRDLEARNKEILESSYAKLYGDIDVSKFRADIDVKRTINIIIWALEGFSAREQEKFRSHSLSELNLDEIIAEMDIYLELLKKCFYK